MYTKLGNLHLGEVFRLNPRYRFTWRTKPIRRTLRSASVSARAGGTGWAAAQAVVTIERPGRTLRLHNHNLKILGHRKGVTRVLVLDVTEPIEITLCSDLRIA